MEKTKHAKPRSLEHDLLKNSLEVNEGSITRAAKSLGISDQDLH